MDNVFDNLKIKGEVYNDPIHRIAYATDASMFREIPLGVAFPADESDIIKLVNLGQKFISDSHNNSSNKSHNSSSNKSHNNSNNNSGVITLIPRGAGTSLAGQVVGKGLVVDISSRMNKILEINPIERWARVEPGVVLDELNLACKEYGLFFAPETSTSNRCTLGGMVGNNSCGSHSLVYGSTREHLLQAKVVLSDGSVELLSDYKISDLEKRFSEKFWDQKCEEGGENGNGGQNEEGESLLIERIYSLFINLALDEVISGEIKNNFPDISLKRRNCGYAIDQVIEGLWDESVPFCDRKINLCKILAGSEGTLAFATELKVNLVPLPPKEKGVICAHCDTLEKALLANLIALKFSPVAIELMDSNVLELSKSNLSQQKNRFFVKGDPAAILIIELAFDSRQELDMAADTLQAALPHSLVYDCSRVYGADISKVWELRKAGLGLLNGMKGDAKPVSVIEDTAVAAERLPEYIKDFREMLSELGLSCVYHAHIATGELHLRPILNIKTESGRGLFREVAYKTALLVKKHKGSLSGEHGDGRLRGEFIKVLYGDYVYGLMRAVKQCWDPIAIFNEGKIIDTPPMDCFLRYDVGQEYAIANGGRGCAFNTYFNWKGSFEGYSQLNSMMCSIEQCNGAGDCRKQSVFGGTMCPSFKVSKNEIMATRCRANVLREILTRGWSSEAFDNIRGGYLGSKSPDPISIPELKEVLDSCLACKGCKSECPSNIDMTRLRAELLQHYYDKCGTPLTPFLVARMGVIQRLGSYVYPIYNLFASWGFTSAIIKKVLKFSVERDIPKLSKRTMRELVKREQRGIKTKISQIEVKGKVYLFADEFTNYSESQLGLTFAKLLIGLGYQVEIPRHCESGRAAISKGCLKLAKRFATKNIELLSPIVSNEHPLIGIEPSCILSFRDEYPDLVDDNMRGKATTLAKNCLLFDEFIMREVNEGRISPDMFKNEKNTEIWLHGHCHQKALIGIESTAAMLRLLPNCKVNVIPSGCCGMAGSFGYEAKNYETSIGIGEEVLFPAVRKALNGKEKGDKNVYVCAPGTSCREQISHGTGYRAIHPIELMWMFFCK